MLTRLIIPCFPKSFKNNSRKNFELQHEGACTSTAATGPNGALSSCQNSTKNGFKTIPFILSKRMGFWQQHVTASVDKGGTLLGSKLENQNKPGLFILLRNSLYPGYFRRTRGRLRVCRGCILFHTFSCDSLKRMYALIEGRRDLYRGV